MTTRSLFSMARLDLRLFAALAALSISISNLSAEVPMLEVDVDIAYKTGDSLSDYEKTRCKLDVYKPKGARDLPCLVWFHGGGLTGGDKSMKSVLSALASEGMVVTSANYRLSPKALYPSYIEDAAAAVAWMREHAKEYGGDPGKVFVAGHSAGGYLAAIVGSDPRYLKKHGINLADLAGIIPLSGQMMTHYAIREERGLPKTTIIADEAAPINHASKDTPPWLILYAEKDMDLRGDENRYFAAALQTAKHSHVTLREMAGQDHGSIGEKIGEAGSPVREAMVSFIRKSSESSAKKTEPASPAPAAAQ